MINNNEKCREADSEQEASLAKTLKERIGKFSNEIASLEQEGKKDGPNLLGGSKCYMIGPIELSDDPDSWRQRTTKTLNEMGVSVYDPMVKPSWAPKITTANKNSFLKDLNEDPQSAHAAFDGMQWIRNIDIRYVYSSDFIVCYLPKVFSMGSCEELAIAAQIGKPVIMWSNPESPIPSSWGAAMLCKTIDQVKETFFDDEDAAMNYLRMVDNNEIELDPFKWVWITYFHQNVRMKNVSNNY